MEHTRRSKQLSLEWGYNAKCSSWWTRPLSHSFFSCLRKSHRHSGSATGEPPIVSSAPYCLRLRSLECGHRPYPVPTETFGLHTDESFACISTIWDRQGQGLQKCCFSKIVMDSIRKKCVSIHALSEAKHWVGVTAQGLWWSALIWFLQREGASKLALVALQPVQFPWVEN